MSIYEQLTQSFESYWESFIDKIPAIIAAVIILMLTYVVSRIIRCAVSKGVRKAKLGDREIALIKRIINFIIVIIGVVLALSALGVNFMALATGLGLVGFAVGFALQDVIKNFLAGILILVQKPFNIGDFITVGNFSGTVKEICTRCSIIKTFEGKKIIVPNADLFSKAVVVSTGQAKRRYSMEVGISYDANIDKAIKVGISTISNIKGVLDDPNLKAIVEKLDNSSVNLKFFYWVKPKEVNILELKSEVMKQVKEAFDREDIEIAYPTMKVIQ